MRRKNDAEIVMFVFGCIVATAGGIITALGYFGTPRDMDAVHIGGVGAAIGLVLMGVFSVMIVRGWGSSG